MVLRHPPLKADITEHRKLLLVVSTHTNYIPYFPVETIVPDAIPPTFFRKL